MIVIDGCMLGVLGKVFVVIYLVFEVVEGGVIVKIYEGDLVIFDVLVGVLKVYVSDEELVKCEL